ncbi:hypothetical protein [Streptomyces sp. NPDC089799]|uniref:hypothetical protein n=1 Tax=Streptomyces sp. NPDC089799 TaxID=3155066 RepID=UPI003418E693
MLTRSRPLLAFLLAASAVCLPASAVSASGPGTECPPFVVDCDIHSGGQKPGKPGKKPGDDGKGGGGGGKGGGGGGGSRKCHARDGSGGTFEVPCYQKEGWWFDESTSCYWKLWEPQPPAGDPAWEGHEPGDGAVYNSECPGQPLLGGFEWRQNPPPGFGGGPDLEALAKEAMSKMRLLGADIGSAPQQGGTGTVGVPVWVWNRPSPRTTGPTSASATALGVTVTATATVQKVVWSFGNGTTVTCAFPGTPYTAAFGLNAPQASAGQCGFPGYARPGQYTVTATTTWDVHWAGGGAQGDLTATRTSEIPVRVGELQVVGQ